MLVTRVCDLLLNKMQGFKTLRYGTLDAVFSATERRSLQRFGTFFCGNTITVDSVKHLKEGMKVDFYAANAAVGSTPAHTGKRILGIDRKNKKITIDGSAITVRPVLSRYRVLTDARFSVLVRSLIPRSRRFTV